MKFISVLLLFSMYSTLSYSQVDYSKLPEDDQRRLREAALLLNGSDRLFLVEGVNGVLRGNNHICWSSSRIFDNTVPGFHHNMTYYTTQNMKSTKSPILESRFPYWYVGTVEKVPTVLLKVTDAKTREFNITGDYLILETQPSCLVMGILTGNTYNSTCLHWVAKNGFTTNRTLCNNAFYKNCTNLRGDWYFWRQRCDNENKPKQAKS
ncbi:uncharacterized protein LOC125945981 isoform X1 [Dermacentor silvarum]|uniref:uncharacterized protein LOC125945981 isoform X1 n=1 Tax=Dermacentor silvarum TaxID=543639 RepID=UPI002100D8D4|nr:uncharacterized protein LOC125945981 isoform X1 [Dermacentor silvarum]